MQLISARSGYRQPLPLVLQFSRISRARGVPIDYRNFQRMRWFPWAPFLGSPGQLCARELTIALILFKLSIYTVLYDVSTCNSRSLKKPGAEVGRGFVDLSLGYIGGINTIAALVTWCLLWTYRRTLAPSYKGVPLGHTSSCSPGLWYASGL